jgi:putative two-component system response regulator
MARRKRILIVDDAPINRELLEAILVGLGYEVENAGDGPVALEALKREFDLVMLDVMMPQMSGFEVVRRIRHGSDQPDVPICMVTALSDKEQRERAIKYGANDFIAKPVDKMEVEVRVASLLRIKEAQDAAKAPEVAAASEIADLRQSLRKMSEERDQAERAQLETIQRLALAAECKDENTANHIKRMSRYCEVLARNLKLPQKEQEIIYYASPMHDVGKAGIPDAILLKPAKLSPEEWTIMKQHTEIGGRILGGSGSELLQAGKLIALSHHEKWDGSGYPNGLAGETIPLHGRICAVADVFDALTSKRPYREPLRNDKALQIMREGKGTHFDAHLLSLFLDTIKEMEAIQRLHPDAEVRPGH